jgi:hypothetical protein
MRRKGEGERDRGEERSRELGEERGTGCNIFRGAEKPTARGNIENVIL